MALDKVFDNPVGAIGRPVVHHNDLPLHFIRQRSRQDAAQNRRNIFFFVEEWNQYRDERGWHARNGIR
jgi:hypothetical protein